MTETSTLSAKDETASGGSAASSSTSLGLSPKADTAAAADGASLPAALHEPFQSAVQERNLILYVVVKSRLLAQDKKRTETLNL